MPVKARFPDGEREVPSHPREIKSRQIGGAPSVFVEEPDYDPDWRFLPVIGGTFIATPRD